MATARIPDKDVDAILKRCLPIVDTFIANHISGKHPSNSVSIDKLKTLRYIMTTRAKRDALTPRQLESGIMCLEQLYDKVHHIIPRNKLMRPSTPETEDESRSNSPKRTLDNLNKPSTSRAGLVPAETERLDKTQPTKTKKSYKTEIIVVIESSDEEDDIAFVGSYEKDKNKAINNAPVPSSSKLSDSNNQNNLENVRINTDIAVIEIEENDSEEVNVVKEKPIRKAVDEELEEGEICDEEEAVNSLSDFQTEDSVVKENDNSQKLIGSSASVTEDRISEQCVENSNNTVEASCNQGDVITQKLKQPRRSSVSNSQVEELVQPNTSSDKGPSCENIVDRGQEVAAEVQEVVQSSTPNEKSSLSEKTAERDQEDASEGKNMIQPSRTTEIVDPVCEKIVSEVQELVQSSTPTEKSSSYKKTVSTCHEDASQMQKMIQPSTPPKKIDQACEKIVSKDKEDDAEVQERVQSSTPIENSLSCERTVATAQEDASAVHKVIQPSTPTEKVDPICETTVSKDKEDTSEMQVLIQSSTTTEIVVPACEKTVSKGKGDDSEVQEVIHSNTSTAKVPSYENTPGRDKIDESEVQELVQSSTPTEKSSSYENTVAMGQVDASKVQKMIQPNTSTEKVNRASEKTVSIDKEDVPKVQELIQSITPTSNEIVDSASEKIVFKDKDDSEVQEMIQSTSSEKDPSFEKTRDRDKEENSEVQELSLSSTSTEKGLSCKKTVARDKEDKSEVQELILTSTSIEKLDPICEKTVSKDKEGNSEVQELIQSTSTEEGPSCEKTVDKGVQELIQSITPIERGPSPEKTVASTPTGKGPICDKIVARDQHIIQSSTSTVKDPSCEETAASSTTGKDPSCENTVAKVKQDDLKIQELKQITSNEKDPPCEKAAASTPTGEDPFCDKTVTRDQRDFSEVQETMQSSTSSEEGPSSEITLAKNQEDVSIVQGIIQSSKPTETDLSCEKTAATGRENDSEVQELNQSQTSHGKSPLCEKIVATEKDNQKIDEEIPATLQIISQGETNNQSCAQIDDNKDLNEVSPLIKGKDAQITNLVPSDTENIMESSIKIESQGLSYSELEQEQVLSDIKKQSSSIPDHISLCSEILEDDEKLEFPDSPSAYNDSQFEYCDIKIEDEELKVQVQSINDDQFDQKIEPSNIKIETTTIPVNQYVTSSVKEEIKIEVEEISDLLHKASASVASHLGHASSCLNEVTHKIVEENLKQELPALESEVDVIDDDKPKSSPNHDNVNREQELIGKDNVEEYKESNLAKMSTNVCEEKDDSETEKNDSKIANNLTDSKSLDNSLNVNKDKPCSLLNNSQNIEEKDKDTKGSVVTEESDMPEPVLKKDMDDETSKKDLFKEKTSEDITNSDSPNLNLEPTRQTVNDLSKHSSKACEIEGDIVKNDDNVCLADDCHRKSESESVLDLNKESELDKSKASESIETIKDNSEQKTDDIQEQSEMYQDSSTATIKDLEVDNVNKAQLNDETTTLKSVAVAKTSSEVLDVEDVLKFSESNAENTNESSTTEEVFSIVVGKDLTKITKKPALETATTMAAKVVDSLNLKVSTDKTNASMLSNDESNKDTTNDEVATKEISVDVNIASKETRSVTLRDIAMDILGEGTKSKVTPPKNSDSSQVIKEYNDSDKNVDKSIITETNPELNKENKSINQADLNRQQSTNEMNTIKNQNQVNVLPKKTASATSISSQSSNAKQPEEEAEEDFSDCLYLDLDESEKSFLEPRQAPQIDFTEPFSDEELQFDDNVKADDHVKSNVNVIAKDVVNQQAKQSGKDNKEITKRDERISLSDISADESPNKYTKLIDLIDISSDDSDVQSISDISDGILQSSFKKIHNLSSESKNDRSSLSNNTKDADTKANIIKTTSPNLTSSKNKYKWFRDKHTPSPDNNSNKSSSCVDRLPVAIPKLTCEPLDPIRLRHDDDESRSKWRVCKNNDRVSSDSTDNEVERNIASYKKRLEEYIPKMKTKKSKKAVVDDDTSNFLKKLDMALGEYDEKNVVVASDKEERRRHKSRKKKHSRSHKKKHKHRHRDVDTESDYHSNDNYPSDCSYSSRNRHKSDSHTKKAKKRLLSYSSNDEKSASTSNYKNTAADDDIIWGSSKYSLPKPREPVTKETPIIELDDDDEDVFKNTPLIDSDRTSHVVPTTSEEVTFPPAQIEEKIENLTKKNEDEKNEDIQEDISHEIPAEDPIIPTKDHQPTKVQEPPVHHKEPDEDKNISPKEIPKEVASNDKPAPTTEERTITLDLTEDDISNWASKDLPELQGILEKLEKEMGLKPLRDFIADSEQVQENQQEDSNALEILSETTFQNSSLHVPPAQSSPISLRQQILPPQELLPQPVPPPPQMVIESQQYMNFNQYNNIGPYTQYGSRHVDPAQSALGGYYGYPQQQQMQIPPRQPPTTTIRTNDPRLCSRLNLQAQKFRSSDPLINSQSSSQVPIPSAVINPRMESIIQNEIQSECLEYVSQLPGAHQAPVNIKKPTVTKATLTYGEYRRRRAELDAEIKRRKEAQIQRVKEAELQRQKEAELEVRKKQEDDEAKARMAQKTTETPQQQNESSDESPKVCNKTKLTTKEEYLKAYGKVKSTKKEDVKVYNKRKSLSPSKDKKSALESGSDSDTPIRIRLKRKRRSSRPLCLESDSSNDSTSAMNTVKRKSLSTPIKELTTNENVNSPTTAEDTLSLDRAEVVKALESIITTGILEKKILNVLEEKVGSERIERIKHVLHNKQASMNEQDTQKVSDVEANQCEIKPTEESPSLSTPSKASATTSSAPTTPSTKTSSNNVVGINKRKAGTKELEKLYRDIDDMFIRDGVINASGKRMCATIAEYKMALQKSGKRKIDSNSSDSDWGDNNLKIKRRKSCSIDPTSSKTKISEEENTRKRHIANDDDDTDDYSEHVREVLSKQNTKTSNKDIVKQCIPTANQYPIVKLTRLRPDIEETVKSQSYIIENNDELLKPLKVIDEPSTTKAKRQVKPKSKQLKNNNINYHTKSKDYDNCYICKKTFGNIVDHYVNTHPYSEVMCSRLCIEDIESLKKTPIKATRIPNTNKYSGMCIFCNKEIKDVFLNFNEHYTTHTGEFAFECSLCDVQKSSKKDILFHCKKQCKSRETSSKYIKLYSYKDDKKISAFVCTLCNYVQLHQPHIIMHLKNQHLLKIVKADDFKEITLAEMPEEEKESTDRNEIDNIAVANEPVTVKSEEAEIVLQIQTASEYIDTGPYMTKEECNDEIDISFNDLKTEKILDELDDIFSETIVDKTTISDQAMTVIHCQNSTNNDENATQDIIDKILQKETQKMTNSESNLKETSFEYTDIVEEKPVISDMTEQFPDNQDNFEENNTECEDIKPTPPQLDSETVTTEALKPEESKSIEVTNMDVTEEPPIETESKSKPIKKEEIKDEKIDIICLDSDDDDDDDCATVKKNEDDVNEKITQKLAELINEKHEPAATDPSILNESCEKQDSEEADYLVIELEDDDNDSEPLDLNQLQNDTEQTSSPVNNYQQGNNDNNLVPASGSQENTAITRVVNIGYSKNANKIQYYCLVEQCRFLSTYDVNELRTHLREHTRTWSGKCNICQKRVYTETKIHLEHELHHLLEVHLNDEDDEASQKLKQMKMSTDYLHVIKNLKPWLCNTISNKTQRLCQEMRKHLQLYALYKCMGNDCAFATSSQSGFLHHLQKHDEKIRSYVSWTPFENPYNMPWLECCYCTEKYEEPDALLNHINEVHSSSIFQCSKCFYRSCASYNVKIHQQIIHNVSNTKEIAIFICHGKTKTIKSEMAEILEHRDKNVKPLQCPGCEKKYFPKKDLMEHINQYHSSKCNIKKVKFGIFACIYCDRETNAIHEIRQHMANKHPTRLLYVCARYLNTEKIHTPVDHASVKSTSLMYIGELVEIGLLKKCPFDISQLCITEASIQHQPNLQDDFINLTELYEPICDIYEGPRRSSRQQSTETIAENVIDFEQLKNSLDDDFGDAKGIIKKNRPTSKNELELAEELLKLINIVVRDTGLSGKKLYVCCIPTCARSFKTYDYWKDHFLLIHPDTLNTGIFQCPHCSDIYQLQEFANHFVLHEIHRFFCYFCGDTFLNFANAEKHLQIRHSYINSRTIRLLPEGSIDNNKDNNDLFNYHKYYVITSTALRADMESLMRHMIDVLKVRCDNKSPNKLNSNSNNTDDSSSSDAKEFTKQNYQQQQQATISLDIEDDNLPKFIKDSKRFVCGYKHCIFKGRTEAHLESHLKEMHTTKSSGAFTCPHCSIQIKYSKKFNNIRDHLRLHSGILFVCYNCNYVHCARPEVTRHINQCHKDIDCIVINYTRAESVMKKQIEMVHSTAAHDIPSSNNNDDIKCLLCTLRFPTYKVLFEHASKSHNITVRYQCEYCKYRDVDKDKVIQHVKIEHDNKIFRYRSVLHKQRDGFGIENFTVAAPEVQIIDDDDTIVINDDNNTSNNSHNEILPEEKYKFENNLYICNCGCQFRADTEEDIKEHIKNNHDDIKMKDDADNSTTSLITKNNTIKTQKPILKCIKCLFACDNEIDLTEHININHEDEQPMPQSVSMSVPEELAPSSIVIYDCPATVSSTATLQSSCKASTSSSEQMPIVTNITIQMDSQNQPVINHNINYTFPQLNTTATAAHTELPVESVQETLPPRPPPPPPKKQGMIRLVPLTKLLKEDFLPPVESSPIETVIQQQNIQTTIPSKTITNSNQIASNVGIVPISTTKNISVQYIESPQQHQQLIKKTTEDLLSEVILICNHCNTMFSNMKDLLNHFNTIHLKFDHRTPFQYCVTRKLSCSYCSYEHCLESIKKHHSASHPNMILTTNKLNNPMQCSECAFSCTGNRIDLFNHFEMHHPDLMRKPVSSNFLTQELLDELLKLGQTSTSYKCRYCNQIYQHENLIRHHIAESHKHYETLYEPYKEMSLLYGCKQCNVLYTNEKPAVHHLRTHTKPYLCKFCGSCFHDYTTLRSHYQLEHNKNEIGYRYINIRKFLFFYSDMILVFPNGLITKKNELKRTIYAKMEDFVKLIETVDKEDLQKCAISLGSDKPLLPQE